jgi:hypothetical protein
VLALPARFELARDPAYPHLEALLPLGELPLPLGHPLGGLAQLALCFGQIVERHGAGLPGTLECLALQKGRRLLRHVVARLSSHRHGF